MEIPTREKITPETPGTPGGKRPYDKYNPEAEGKTETPITIEQKPSYQPPPQQQQMQYPPGYQYPQALPPPGSNNVAPTFNNYYGRNGGDGNRSDSYNQERGYKTYRDFTFVNDPKERKRRKDWRRSRKAAYWVNVPPILKPVFFKYSIKFTMNNMNLGIDSVGLGIKDSAIFSLVFVPETSNELMNFFRQNPGRLSYSIYTVVVKFTFNKTLPGEAKFKFNSGASISPDGTYGFKGMKEDHFKNYRTVKSEKNAFISVKPTLLNATEIIAGNIQKSTDAASGKILLNTKTCLKQSKKEYIPVCYTDIRWHILYGMWTPQDMKIDSNMFDLELEFYIGLK